MLAQEMRDDLKDLTAFIIGWNVHAVGCGVVDFQCSLEDLDLAIVQQDILLLQQPDLHSGIRPYRRRPARSGRCRGPPAGPPTLVATSI